MKKVIIAMSGGVDSSVAALLTKESGDECIGATMKLYNNEDIGVHREKTCCSLSKKRRRTKMSHNPYIYILIMAAVTFAIRVLPLTLVKKQFTNTFVRSFLYYVPYVTLSVMTFPAIIKQLTVRLQA